MDSLRGPGDTDVLSYDKGLRIDGKNHNWLILKNYLSLPFSYMTFVIKTKLEDGDPTALANVFDPEGYNYLFNKGTCFIDSNFAKVDY